MESSTDRNSICDTTDVEVVYEVFSAGLTELYESSFPLVPGVTKPIDLRNVFINSDLRVLIKEKHKPENKFKRYPRLIEKSIEFCAAE